ncbi:hypothetical protein HF1_06490 [Mycoplasma haemofelis str. Langford 1]|uniref:Uncharacterized protein n=1 Tax=Mycoplasma haemofelis (strain Langford 1) TaxID=941640 RepID=E8ZHN6_MYCHL|nr:hypothetical protein [Mycoplasma haemofelis]CBY92657.1 hypothetical protein HF1_06490 [Mycoplasma haemofelis str. Langford 1]
MVLSTLAKALLGGSLLAAGTGLSVGKAIFFSEDSNSENFVATSSKSVVEDQLEEESEDTSSSGEPVKEQVVAESPVSEIKEVPPAPAKPEKKCTIYKILSSYSRTTSKAEEDFLEKEVKDQSQSYKDIQGVCDKANGKNIYLSRENVGSWWYPRYEWVYNKSKQNINWIVK